ncbi:MAG TPA: metalloregulator ArsR/SmtB family transcription factor [Bacillota bacterium]|nr:winged helix-turn-helix transcriptional regulator [Candidatus Fermentithermobacillaceae bacterium]HOB30040.1 metalloregulator ArsR/SmtB family transcription factor [Bacillota bacterium]HOK63930.1 metalloregulator ArsR/SmtB family transcription factor [Bacillota bacterium]HOL11285.1 metalloregulator ArsR/SmtB family transcription factor [Bacillota bacterium]HOQ02414.1 metalloregulator ArsR/SmtB family transcription factor [Bacillota bacterium]
MTDDLDVCLPHDIDQDKIRKWQDQMPDMDYVVSIFKVMADETRLSILWLLSVDEWCVHDLAAAVNSSVSNVSHHLRLLRTSRLVKSRREGQRVFYSLDDEHVIRLLDEAFKHSQHK